MDATVRDHLAGIAQKAMSFVDKPDPKVLDIGCNEGTLPPPYPKQANRYGVDLQFWWADSVLVGVTRPDREFVEPIVCRPINSVDEITTRSPYIA